MSKEQQKIIQNLMNKSNKNFVNNLSKKIENSNSFSETDTIVNNIKNEIFQDFIKNNNYNNRNIINNFIEKQDTKKNKLEEKDIKKNKLEENSNSNLNRKNADDELRKHIIQMMEVSNEYCDYEYEYILKNYDCNTVDKYLVHYERYMNYKLIFNSIESEKLFIRLINADEYYIKKKYNKNFKELIYKMFKIKGMNKKVYYNYCEENKDINKEDKSHIKECKCNIKVKSVVNLSINTFIKIINNDFYNLNSNKEKETLNNYLINKESIDINDYIRKDKNMYDNISKDKNNNSGEERNLVDFYKSVNEFINNKKTKISENTRLINNNNKEIISCLNLLNSVKKVLGMDKESTYNINIEDEIVQENSFINLRTNKDLSRYNFNFDSDLNLDTTEDSNSSEIYINQSKSLKNLKKTRTKTDKLEYNISNGKIIDNIIDDLKYIKNEIIYYNKNKDKEIDLNNLENIKRISHYKILLNDLKQRIKINTNDIISNNFSNIYTDIINITNENYIQNIKKIEEMIEMILKRLNYNLEI